MCLGESFILVQALQKPGTCSVALHSRRRFCFQLLSWCCAFVCAMAEIPRERIASLPKECQLVQAEVVSREIPSADLGTPGNRRATTCSAMALRLTFDAAFCPRRQVAGISLSVTAIRVVRCTLQRIRRLGSRCAIDRPRRRMRRKRSFVAT